jgi:predicted MPP superfamily phosphohydrolase
MYQLHVHEKTIGHPRLPESLDRLSIAHLSDLHLSGAITRPFFEHVVERANQLEPDIVALTGDIIDTDRCLDWLPHTVGKLKSRYGSFFILGNHDLRLPDTGALRSALTDVGLVDLGGRWQVIEGMGEQVLIAGNEWPWFGPRPDPPAATRTFRILLSHSPDQIRWARRHSFDLMLAGHTHGGQIRLPILGPILAPSLHGVKYACGVFEEAPTCLHVSRGISSLEPIRFNCPPELTKLVLKAAV